MTLEELKGSMLVEGPGEEYPNWDSKWRLKLVENLEVLVGQLWEVGITEIFVDGLFVEDKEHLQRELNMLDPHKVWTWDLASRRPYRDQPKLQLCLCGSATGWNFTHTTRTCRCRAE